MAGDSTGMSFSHLRNNTNKKWWLDPCLRVNVVQCIGLYFCVFYLGYDAALLNGYVVLASKHQRPLTS
jgi:hypothetical protein